MTPAVSKSLEVRKSEIIRFSNVLYKVLHIQVVPVLDRLIKHRQHLSNSAAEEEWRGHLTIQRVLGYHVPVMTFKIIELRKKLAVIYNICPTHRIILNECFKIQGKTLGQER